MSKQTLSLETLAFFGATGGTGRATLHTLLSDPRYYSLPLQIFVRSKRKLLSLFPELESRSGVQIWEGQLDDVHGIKECLSGADVIICTLGENQNLPGLDVLQRGATSILHALGELKEKQGANWFKPRLLFLSSSTWNTRLSAHMPALMLRIIKTAFYYPYFDLRQATRMFQESPDLVSLLLVQPPAIVEDAPSGYQISTETSNPVVSYADLGAAFLELATERSYDTLDAVGVSSLQEGALRKWGSELFSRIVIGLIAGSMPGYWSLKKLWAE
ncbi:putative NAD(P)-binding domain-containing protein [Seiridium cardinale]|uniref:NAD(P)-binding domain-containing protein n=1 Tax=Seiridium cardinale TaxID=138064 RepID=A0ABR2XXH9_9PEZI